MNEDGLIMFVQFDKICLKNTINHFFSRENYNNFGFGQGLTKRVGVQ